MKLPGHLYMLTRWRLRCFPSLFSPREAVVLGVQNLPQPFLEDERPNFSTRENGQKFPAEIELLDTRVRFESDGSSRKEFHARVKINDELGACANSPA